MDSNDLVNKHAMPDGRLATATGGRQVSEQIALGLLALLEETGVDVRSLLKDSHCSCTYEDFVRSRGYLLSAEQLHSLNARAIYTVVSMANAQDGRPTLRMRDWRMLFFCVVSSRTLREVILRAADFYQMLENGWGRLALQVDGTTAQLNLDTMRTRRNATAFVADTMGIAALHGLFGWLIGRTVPLTAVLLSYAEAMRPYYCSPVLPFPLTLGTDRTAIRFPSNYLDFPVVRTAQDCGERLILSFALEIQDDPVSDIAERARRIMYRLLRDSHRVPSLLELSEKLEMNRATLRRQLTHSGVSYNQLKESCRRELALDLLRRSALSIEQIADRLGYCDSDAFRRAFREWIGVSPSTYRRDAESGSLHPADPPAQAIQPVAEIDDREP